MEVHVVRMNPTVHVHTRLKEDEGLFFLNADRAVRRGEMHSAKRGGPVKSERL